MLADEKARIKAATDFKHNLVVLAGAGTGKTSLLVERVLNACLGEDFSLNEILAITFTEKAAAQMRDRIAESLEDIRTLKPEKARNEAKRSFIYLKKKKKLNDMTIYKRALRALAELDDAPISTIHGFCADLLRRYPREAGLDPHFQVDEGSAALRLMNELWEEWIKEELQTKSANGALWEQLLGIMDLRTIHKIAHELILLDFSMRTVGEGEALSEKLLMDQCGKLSQLIDEILSRISGENPNMRNYLEIESHWLKQVATKGIAILPDDFGYPSKNVPEPGKKLIGTDPLEIKKLAKQADQLLKRLKEIDPSLFPKLVKLLLSWTDRFWLIYKREGYISFSGLLQRARDLLIKNKELRSREKERIKCLLLDEFQDTSPIQYEIIFLLSEDEKENGKNAFNLKFHPGKTFVVGDLKQSIYRFNGADIHVCELMANRLSGSGAEVLSLNTNFRSPESILEPLNQLFTKNFDKTQQVKFEAIYPAQNKNHQPPAIYVWTIEAGVEEAKKKDLRRLEAQSISDWIQNKRGNIKYKDIAILLRSMSEVSIYLEAMRERLIPFVVEGGKTFAGKPEVREFLALMKVLVNPSDQVAILAVLRSPLGGANDVELAKHAQYKGLWCLDAEVDLLQCPNIARTFSKLKNLVHLCASLPVETAIRTVIDQMQMWVLNAVSYEGAQRIANLTKLKDHAVLISRHQKLSLRDTLQILEEEFVRTRAKEGESPLADEKLDAVRVLTIHKSKGLEFPVVLIPDLIRGTNISSRGDIEVSWKHLEDGQYGLSLKLKAKNKILRNFANVLLDLQEQVEGENEMMRLFYVATTRAKEKLMLIVSAGKKSLWVDALQVWGYPSECLSDGKVALRKLGPVKKGKHPRLEKENYTHVLTGVKDFETVRAEAEKLKGVSWIVSPSGLAHESNSHEEEEKRKEHSDVSALAGSAVHWLLQTWDLKNKNWLMNNIDISLKSVCKEDSKKVLVKKKAAKILEKFLGSDLPDKMQKLDIIGREVPIECAMEGKLVSGIIDLLYRDGDEIVIADYKTDQVKDVKELEEKYKEQIFSYKKAIHKIFGNKVRVRGELWSLVLGRVG